MFRKLLLHGTLTLFCGVITCAQAFAQSPDLGVPDSAYFRAPTYEMRSCSEVVVTLPVYIWSDHFSDYNVFRFFGRGMPSAIPCLFLKPEPSIQRYRQCLSYLLRRKFMAAVIPNRYHFVLPWEQSFSLS